MIQRWEDDGPGSMHKSADGFWCIFKEAEEWVREEVEKWAGDRKEWMDKAMALARKNCDLQKEIAALKEKYRELENQYVLQGAIYDGISDILRDGTTSDFMLSFQIVRQVADLRERACCLPTNEWGHTKNCTKEQIAALIEEGQEAARINNHNVEVASQEIAALKEKIKEQDEEVYCPTCGACGEGGCCPPDRCEHLKCFYGEHYASTYRELEAENERLLIFVKSVATEGQHDLGNNKLCDCALCRIIRSATKTKEGI